MLRLLLLVVRIAALAGCQSPNPNYCPPGSAMCTPDGGSERRPGNHSTAARGMLSSTATAATANQGKCEPCTTSNIGVCAGTTPRCESNACVACADDVQDCKGGVCLATGDCAATSRILHASSTSSKSSGCGDAAMPCSLAGALGSATADKNVIKLDDVGPFVTNGLTVTADVTVDARVNGGAALSRVDGGPIITVMGGKTLTLLGGTIQGAHGGMGSGIVCNGATVNVDQMTITGGDHLGIDATNCTVTVTRARIENNMETGVKASGGSLTLVRTWLDTNSGGGVDVNSNAKFTIVGNVIVNNGTTTGSIGGIGILTNAANNRLEFNSIAENKAQMTAAAGITCTANANFTAKNNIIWSNNSFVANMMGIQVSGACGHSYSDIGPAAITGPINIGNNQSIDPKFKDKATDLHLMSGNQLQQLQQSDPGSVLTDIAAKDIDGDPRVSPAYIGADQYYPPKT